MRPIIRKEVRFSLLGLNFSLTQLRGSTYPGIRVVKVEAYNGKQHNTKVTIEIDNALISKPELRLNEGVVRRVCLYNRLDLNTIIPNTLNISRRGIENTIVRFNRSGYDFNEDDLEFKGGLLCAKESSLGYFGELALNPYNDAYRLISEDGTIGILTENETRILIEESLNV